MAHSSYMPVSQFVSDAFAAYQSFAHRKEATMIYGWSPGIGDPTFLGWFTVVLYFVAALACVFASRKEIEAGRLWCFLALALALLGLNKQLDLQSLLTAFGRELANSEGWYDRRRDVQKAFVAVVGVIGLLGAIVTSVKLGKASRQIRWAFAGFLLLGAFVCIRAASFHHVDRFLNSGIFGARFNWIFELGGIAIIALNALRARRTVRPNNSCIGRSAEKAAL